MNNRKTGNYCYSQHAHCFYFSVLLIGGVQGSTYLHGNRGISYIMHDKHISSCPIQYLLNDLYFGIKKRAIHQRRIAQSSLKRNITQQYYNLVLVKKKGTSHNVQKNL